MISVSNLVQQDYLPGNYFAPDVYLQGDVEMGLLENRSGSRLIAVPETLLQGIYIGLQEEIGSASKVVLYQCGRHWGKHFYRRFGEEISGYYKKSLAQMAMVEFLQCLKQCWKTSGWGVIDFDFNYYQKGFIVAKIQNSPFAAVANAGDPTMGYAEAGILSAFFSELTGKDLHAVQISSDTPEAQWHHFVIGLENRIKAAEAWLSEGQDHETIMERLSRSTPSGNN